MRQIILILILFLLSSCTHSPLADENTFSISYKEGFIFDWDSNVQIEEVIPLETKDDCLLGYARKCIVADNQIIYYDEKQKSIFVFNETGDFLYEIDALGGGKDEYTIIKDIIVSYDKKSILVLDNASVLSFDIKTGTFQDRIVLDENIAPDFYQFVNVGKESFYFWSTDKDNCLYSYVNGQIEAMRKRTGFPYVCQKFFYDSTGNLTLLPDYGCFNFEVIDNLSLHTKYIFDFGRNTLSETLIPANVSELGNVDQKPYFKCIMSAFETEQNLFATTVSPDGSLYNICIDKPTKEVVSGIQDKDAPVVVVDAVGEYFYGILYPFFFSKEDRFLKEIRKYGRDEDSNPLIIKFTFKFSEHQ